VAHGEGPEFKPQYRKRKKKKTFGKAMRDVKLLATKV
jgi:hypothetical protein